MASPYWLTFAGHKPGCVEAESIEEAQRIGAEVTSSEVLSCQVLPYPAEPRLHTVAGKWGVTPSFCYTPGECAGNSRCTKRRSCTD